MFCMSKRITALLLALIILSCSMPLTASALESVNMDAPVFLTIQFLDDVEGGSKPVVGAQFDLYYAAAMETDGSFTLAGDFQNYPVEVNGLDAEGWRQLTSTLRNYVSADQLAPMDSGSTGEDGKLTFPSSVERLTPGLYLVVGLPLVDEEFVCQAEPFLVSLPGLDVDGDQWQYHVSVRVKYTKEPITPDDTVARHVLKVWEGDAEQIRPEQIQVELRADGVVYDTVMLNAENHWRHHWPELPRHDTDGNEILWSIVELAVEDYLVTVTQEGITFRLTNTYAPDVDDTTVRRSVMKVWNDKGYEDERPVRIQVHLLRNGEIWDTRILEESNDWQCVWEELPARDDSGNEIAWTVQEAEIKGYFPSYTEMGEHILITNSIIKPSLPQTGVLWWPVPVLVALGLLMLILGKLVKGRSENA